MTSCTHTHQISIYDMPCCLGLRARWKTYSQDLVTNFSSSAEICHVEISRDTRREQTTRCHGQRATEVDFKQLVFMPWDGVLLDKTGYMNIPMLAIVPPWRILRRFCKPSSAASHQCFKAEIVPHSVFLLDIQFKVHSARSSSRHFKLGLR